MGVSVAAQPLRRRRRTLPYIDITFPREQENLPQEGQGGASISTSTISQGSLSRLTCREAALLEWYAWKRGMGLKLPG